MKSCFSRVHFAAALFSSVPSPGCPGLLPFCFLMLWSELREQPSLRQNCLFPLAQGYPSWSAVCNEQFVRELWIFKVHIFLAGPALLPCHCSPFNSRAGIVMIAPETLQKTEQDFSKAPPAAQRFCTSDGSSKCHFLLCQGCF